MSGPDFLIIGAMKSGTTTLQEQLSRQPGIFMTTPKEPNFFSDDKHYAKGQAWYSSLFEDANASDLKGEASTHYTKLPTYPETITRLKAAVPNPKLIYMIRNPLDRLVSHYIHGWSQTEISVPFDRALTAHPELVSYGQYGMQIRPFVEAFGQEAIYLTSLEQYKADPDRILDEIGRFIGASSPLRMKTDVDPQNVSADRYRKLPLSGLLVENVVARSLRRLLVPKRLREKIRQARTRKDRPQYSSDDLRRLQAVFLQDRTALADMFPNHPALRLCYPFSQ